MKFEWEHIATESRRAAVIGGWIVNTYSADENGMSEALCFVPDQNHEWEIEK